MNTGTDVDQMLAQAAAMERASHVDPAFVAQVDLVLSRESWWSSRRSWLGLMPALAVVLATVLVGPVLAAEPASLSVLWDWLSEPPGLQSVVDGITAAAPAALWPYAAGLFAVLLPFSLLDAEL